MSAKTGIEWTDATWNPVTGCTKVSPGCAHCYAERVTERFHGKGSFDKVILHPERLAQPLRWKHPRRIFVNSMSDLFHEEVSASFIIRVFAEMLSGGVLRNHVFQVLTKRPKRMLSIVGDKNFMECVFKEACVSGPWPLPFVWLGVSVENQHFADERIPLLMQTPAVVRFISAEPLLEEVVLDLPPERFNERELNWVICGGESGPDARPMNIEWARSLREQCKKAGVPFFMKQLGGWPDKRGEMEDFPVDLQVREFPR